MTELLKDQIASLEREIAKARETEQQCTGALKLARHLLAIEEQKAKIVAEAEKAKAEAAAAEKTKDAPEIDASHV